MHRHGGPGIIDSKPEEEEQTVKTTKTLWAGIAALAACAGSGGPSGPGPAGALAYAVPAASPLVYEIADTTAISMDIAGTPVDINGYSESTMQVAYAQVGSGVRATARFTALTGSFANSMGPTETLSAADMPGPATLTVGPRGDVTVSDAPVLTERAAQILGTQGAWLRLFARLPGRAATPGTAWTDTVQVNDDAGGMASATTVILTSTLAGDTTVAGRQLRLIRTTGRVTTRVAGNNQGVEVRQTLTGTSEGIVLWDPSLNALAQRDETTLMNGTMELPAMGMAGIPVIYHNRQVVRVRR